MRTKEKFYENLNNKHVSLEKRIERFEFRDVKTLDALSSEAKSLTSKVSTAYKDLQKTDDELKAWKQMVKMAEKGRDEALKESEKILQRIEQQKKLRKDNEKTAYDRLEDANEKMDEAKVMANEAASILLTLDARAEDLLDKINRSITEFEASARGMGVHDKVSGLISKYKTVSNKLKEVL